MVILSLKRSLRSISLHPQKANYFQQRNAYAVPHPKTAIALLTSSKSDRTPTPQTAIALPTPKAIALPNIPNKRSHFPTFLKTAIAHPPHPKKRSLILTSPQQRSHILTSQNSDRIPTPPKSDRTPTSPNAIALSTFLK